MSSLVCRSCAWVLALVVAACAPAYDGSGGPSAGAEPPFDETSARSTAPAPVLQTEESCELAPSLPVVRGELRQYLRSRPISRAWSEQFAEPTPQTLAAFEAALEAVIRTSSEGAADLRELGFGVRVFIQDGGGGWLVVEDLVAGRGAGTFVINLEPAREVWFEVPHELFDKGTLQQASEALVQVGGRALIITGAHRCATRALTPCEGSSSVCNGSLRRSDVAHNTQTFFHSAHRALRSAFPKSLAISVHGMAAGTEAALVSDGTREANPRSISQRLRDALNAQLPLERRAYSCNDAADAGLHRGMCGTTNVQGRSDNASADACRAGATSGSGLFIHLEQGPELRPMTADGAQFPHVLDTAVASMLPCSLGGNGLDCAPVSFACR